MKVFYVEDDVNIRELVLYTLEQTGFEAKGFPDGESFLVAMEKGEKPDLILLDIMLPKKDGLTILKTFREHEKYAHLPVIIVSAKDSEFDKVKGLELGADDYVTKPFGMMELTARIKAVLRRAPRENKDKDEDEVQIGTVRIHFKRRIVMVDRVPIHLTYKEFELLSYLMFNRGVIFSRDKLLSIIWGYDYYGGTRTVDVHIQTLRQKLGTQKDWIETVRGVGYRIPAQVKG